MCPHSDIPKQECTQAIRRLSRRLGHTWVQPDRKAVEICVMWAAKMKWYSGVVPFFKVIVGVVICLDQVLL